MKITIVGYGNMGAAFARALARAHIPVVMTGRDVTKAAKAVKDLGAYAGVLPLTEALASAEIVVLAVPYAEALLIAEHQRELLGGKTVVDLTNPLTPDYQGLVLGHDTSAAEQIAAHLPPSTQLVKAFNTVFAEVLAEGVTFDRRPASVFMASDSEAGKGQIRGLIEVLGLAPVDCGPLRAARYLEPLAGLNILLAYGLGHGTRMAPAFLKSAA